MKTLTSLLLLLVTAAVANAQLRPRNLSEVPRYFMAECNLAGEGGCTIQQPAMGANKVRLVSALVYCATDCTVSQERNGTAATATGVTEKSLNPDRSDTPKAQVFTATNSTTPAVTWPDVEVQAGVATTIGFDSTVYLIGNGTTKNYTMRLSAAGKIALLWEEYD